MEMTPIAWILTFVLSGTNLWTIVMYFLDKRKRDLENKSSQADLDDKEFETLKKQLEYQDSLIEKYEAKLKERDSIDDELRSELMIIKRGKFEAEKLVLKLQIKYDEDACLQLNCPNRIKPKSIQNGNEEE